MHKVEKSPALGSAEYTIERLRLLPTDQVHPHEETRPAAVYSIQAAMNAIDPVLHKRLSPLPILVAPLDKKETEFVVLDGMHRYQAMKGRGCAHVLAFVLPYDSVELLGWDSIVPANLGLNFEAIRQSTVEDFAKLGKNELAGGKTITWHKTVCQAEELEAKLIGIAEKSPPFILAVRSDEGIDIWTVKLRGKDSFTLKEKVQVQIDLDEAMADACGGDKSFSYVSSDVSLNDFNYTKAAALLVRSRFSKEEVKEAARNRYLLPKKTTRHKFPIRPLVKIEVNLLDDQLMPQAEKETLLREFIKTSYRQPRFYEEPTHDFGDVVSSQDLSQQCTLPHVAREAKKQIEESKQLHWAREWAPPEGLLVNVPGPVGFRDPEVTGAGWAASLIGHRSPEFSNLYNATTDAVRWLLCPNGGQTYRELEAYLIAGPASEAMAIAALSATVQDQRILHIEAGSFGRRWAEISNDYNQNYDIFHLKPGEIFTDTKLIELKDILLAGNGKFSAVSIVFNETSSGTVYNLQQLYQTIKAVEDELNQDILFLVDAASGFGGMEIPNLENIDFLVLSTEKCLALPPGISLLAVNQRAICHAQKVQSLGGRPTGYTTSLIRIRDHHFKGQTLATPAIPQIAMLLKTIQKIHGYISLDGRYVPGEGRSERFARFAEQAQKCQEWAEQMNFSLLATEKNAASTTLSAIRTTPFSGDDLASYLRLEEQLDLSAGHRHLTDQYNNKIDLLRFPHMGTQTLADLLAILSQVTMAVAAQAKKLLAKGTINQREFREWEQRCEETGNWIIGK